MQEISAHIAASPLTMLVVMAIVIGAAMVQFGLGMGFGLTAAPLLALINPELVPASTLFIGLLTSMLGAWAERHLIDWREVAIASAGRVVGVFGAMTILLSLADRSLFSLLFGLFIALAVLLSLAGLRLAFTSRNLVLMASFSGLMGTITSVGAPPLAIMYQHRKAETARPTLAAFFSVGCAISLGGLYLSGWADEKDAVLALIMIPAVVLGYALSRYLGKRFNRRYRPLLLGIAAIAALVLIFRGMQYWY